MRNEDGDEEPESVTPAKIALHLFQGLRGTNNLVFPNSRREVERYTHLLNKLCAQEKVPNEFWPHHGSLSKEIRSETEAALKQKEFPATAIWAKDGRRRHSLGSGLRRIVVARVKGCLGHRRRWPFALLCAPGSLA